MTKPSAAKASAWSALEIVLRQGLQFVVSVILARILAPEDFGVIALLAFFTGFAIVFVQGGLSIALIQRQQTSHLEESTVFWWNLIASLIVGLVFIAAAPGMAAFFGQPVLKPLALLAAVQLVLSAAGAVHTALLTRQMRFDVLTKASIAATLLSGVIAIAAALRGAEVWALALQQVSMILVNTLALWFALDWRPQWHFRFQTIRQFFSYGAWVSVGNIMEVVYTNGISLLIGKLFGVRELGFYNRAVSLQLLPSSSLSGLIGRVLLPSLASKQDDPVALSRRLGLANSCVMLLNVPLMAGLALMSDEIVTVLFGTRWLASAPLLSILAIGGILLPLHTNNVQMMLARAQTRTFMRNEVAKKCIGLGCIVSGSFFGVTGLAWSQVAYSALGLLVNAAPAGRDLGFGPLRQLWGLAGIFGAMLIMAASVYFLKATLTTGPLAALIVCSLAGLVVYAMVGWFGGFRSFREPIEFLIREFAGPRDARIS